MWRRCKLPALILYLSAGLCQAALPDVLERCCEVGRLWFTTNRERCSVYRSTVPGVARTDRAACSAVVDLCCMSQRQDRQCTLGKQSARLRRSCSALSSRPGSEHARECCHCCNVGITAHEAGLPCSLMVRFGHHCDAAFRECCEHGRRPPPATSTPVDSIHLHTSSLPGPPTTSTQSSLPQEGNDSGICARFPDQLCAHVCINTPDSYRCACREGFTLQSDGRTCQQNMIRSRCETSNPCHHECIDNGVAINCRCFDGFRLEPDGRNCRDIDECQQRRRVCSEQQRCVNTEGSYTCEGPSGPATDHADQCPVGYSEDPDTGRCEDVNECVIGLEPCSGGQQCVNTPGSFRCQPRHPGSDDEEDLDRQSDVAVGDVDLNGDGRPTGGTGPLATTTTSTTTTTPPALTTTPRRDGPSGLHCGTGFQYNRRNGRCEDINECALNRDTCVEGQTCENTIGSFACRRSMSCGTGYTLDQATQQCLDNDECRLGTHNCGVARDCHNIEGSFRCLPRNCPRGYRLDFRTGNCDPIICPRGRRPDDVGNCVDINECEERPAVCRANQECRNTVGSYTCHNLVTCSAGYQLNDDGSRCEDVDECQEGTHECTGALMHCVNRPGTYVCQCSDGFQMNHALRVCEDLDECSFSGHVCSQTARCENTYGSYRCVCKEGFEQETDSQNCQDVDECLRPGMCQHSCRNTWGSFQCMCDDGYQLAVDGRSCDDVDECREAADRGHHVCLGDCENTHGSFTCSCPRGYQMSSDQRTCHDVDECYLRTANCNGADDVCINTRGGYKCQSVTCPRGFVKSPVVGNRSNNIKCQRKTFLCPQGDAECLYAPLSYSTNFITFPSRIRIPADLFTMRGPLSPYRRLAFDLKLIKAEDPRTGQRRISQSHFAVKQVRDNEAVIQLLLPVEGPQDVELQLDMNIFSREFRQNDDEVFFGTAVAKIYVYITGDDW